MVFDCQGCPTPCDGKSKMEYRFSRDVEFAEQSETLVRNKIDREGGLRSQKCRREGYPDIEVYNRSHTIERYIEVKAQRRAFMTVESLLPQANLKPSETVALNLSDCGGILP